MTAYIPTVICAKCRKELPYPTQVSRRMDGRARYIERVLPR